MRSWWIQKKFAGNATEEEEEKTWDARYADLIALWKQKIIIQGSIWIESFILSMKWAGLRESRAVFCFKLSFDEEKNG